MYRSDLDTDAGQLAYANELLAARLIAEHIIRDAMLSAKLEGSYS